MRNALAVLTLTLAVLIPADSLAAQAPIQISIFPPLQIVDESEAVKGLRLSIYGRNTSMTGIDLGLVTHTTSSFEGVQWSVASFNEGSTRGVQLGGVNITMGELNGAQLGVVNSTAGGGGLQWGAFNHTRNFRGLQIAFVNYAETLNGIQLGLINIIREGGVLPVMPFVNWSLD